MLQSHKFARNKHAASISVSRDAVRRGNDQVFAFIYLQLLLSRLRIRYFPDTALIISSDACWLGS